MVQNPYRQLLRRLRLKRLVIFRDPENIEFSYRGFLTLSLVWTAVLLTAALIICSALSSTALKAQSQSHWYEYLGWFVGMHVLLSLFEWYYHRYVLHKVVWKIFASQRREHKHHHGITDVSAKVNDYVIEHPHQTESATFPWYAIPAFWGVFSTVIIPLQLLFPASPVLVSCYPAVTFSLMLYETYHAAMHLDYERYWRKWVERYQWVYRLYAFHYIHHANEQVNQAIGGFFGWAVWDKVFGTYYVPEQRLPLPNEPLKTALKPPKPWRFVQKWDEHAKIRQERNLKPRQRKT